MDLHPEDRVLADPAMSTKTHATLGEAAEAYLAYRRGRGAAKTTMTTFTRTLRRFVKDTGNLQMRNLRPDHVTNWFYGPKGLMSPHIGDTRNGRKVFEAVSPATHNQYRSVLLGFFNWANKRGMTRHDLVEDVPFMKVPAKKRLQPSPEVMVKFLDSALTPRDRGYLAMAMNTGLRTSEITRMRVGDIDLEQGVMFVTRSKGGEEDYLPITEDLDRELKQWFTEYAGAIDVPLTDDMFLFPTITAARFDHWEGGHWRQGGKMIFTERALEPHSEWTQRTEYVVQRALKAAGLPTKYEGTHTIRRAVARAYFDSMTSDVGYDAALRTVGVLLGHKNSFTTERYLGLSTERERRDMMLRGKPFLSAMEASPDNVVPMRRAKKTE